MKIFTVSLFLVTISLWFILSIWREYSLRKEYNISTSYTIYNLLKGQGNENALKQFEHMKEVFEKYYEEKDSITEPRDLGGMTIYKSTFGLFKPDLGMRFAAFPSLIFHLIFATISIVLYFIKTIVFK